MKFSERVPESPVICNRGSALLGAVLVVVVLLLYVPVVHHQFINGWDDDAYITRNIHVTTGFTLANLNWAFTTTRPFYWHPVTWLSHMLDFQLFGLNSGAHHYVNVVLHAANALLLFLLLLRATAARWRSFVAAALFAVHPLNVETVAWAAERKSLLCTLFSLVTIAVYGWYAQRPTWQRYLALMAAFLLALMCKPSAVMVPALLLLMDFWPLNRYPERQRHAAGLCSCWKSYRSWGWLRGFRLSRLPAVTRRMCWCLSRFCRSQRELKTP
jgi:hypothetical protein